MTNRSTAFRIRCLDLIVLWFYPHNYAIMAAKTFVYLEMPVSVTYLEGPFLSFQILWATHNAILCDIFLHLHQSLYLKLLF